jgi:hypothetical protein
MLQGEQDGAAIFFDHGSARHLNSFIYDQPPAIWPLPGPGLPQVLQPVPAPPASAAPATAILRTTGILKKHFSHSVPPVWLDKYSPRQARTMHAWCLHADLRNRLAADCLGRHELLQAVAPAIATLTGIPRHGSVRVGCASRG